VNLAVLSPVTGRAMPLQDVPDPVFAGAIVGPGVAVDPPRERVDVFSPVDGRLVKLHPHAFVVLAVLPEGGVGVLVHLGIDTVQLKGEGFTLYVDEGAEVEAGQKIVSWDPAEIEAGGRSPICPVVALDAKREALGDLVEEGPVEAGTRLFSWSV
jgi:PTS system N-acetylglucosamine-specific IIA component